VKQHVEKVLSVVTCHEHNKTMPPFVAISIRPPANKYFDSILMPPTEPTIASAIKSSAITPTKGYTYL